jgi:hypothetical protein
MERSSRHKQEFELVLHAFHRLLHQVHVLAAVARVVLPAWVKVHHPVHWRLTRGEGTVPKTNELQAGANLDGPIKHPHTGKVLCILYSAPVYAAKLVAADALLFCVI